jgi:hypothetical protein
MRCRMHLVNDAIERNQRRNIGKGSAANIHAR